MSSIKTTKSIKFSLTLITSYKYNMPVNIVLIGNPCINYLDYLPTALLSRGGSIFRMRIAGNCGNCDGFDGCDGWQTPNRKVLS
jgi:hypothetical protein